MLNAADIIKMLVGLGEVGDLDIVSGETILSVTCNVKDRPNVLAMATIIDQLLRSFDYEKSPEFELRIEGKSSQVQAMHRKLLSSERRRQLSERFGKAIADLLESREVYDLVPIANHDLLEELKTIASRIGRV